MIEHTLSNLSSQSNNSKSGSASQSDVDNALSLQPVRYGVGFDVHKEKIVVCVKAQLRDASIIEVKIHTFLASPPGITELVRFLEKYTPIAHYLMECTGVYHLPLYFALKNAFPHSALKIVAMNPLLVNRKLTEFGRKFDKADAQGMATLCFYDGLVKPSYIGEPQFIALRDLLRNYSTLQKQLTSYKNRIHRILCISNQKFPFDLKKEWSLELLRAYISKEWSLLDAYTSLLQSLKTKNKPTGVLEKQTQELAAFGSIILNHTTRFHLGLILQEFQYESTIAGILLERVEQMILQDSTFKLNYENLLKIPSIGALTALSLLVELGDFSRFTSWREMAKYAGVVPNIEQSAEIVHKGHINRQTNGLLRYILCQSAAILINRVDKATDLGEFAYKQFHIKHLPFKKATIKVAQKLIRVVFNVLQLKVPYVPTYEKQVRQELIRNRQFARQGTYLENGRTRLLKHDIQSFLVDNSELLNSSTRYHLIHGFNHMIDKLKNIEIGNHNPRKRNEKKETDL
jgi:transposase